MIYELVFTLQYLLPEVCRTCKQTKDSKQKTLNTNYTIVPADVINGFMDIYLNTNGGICPVEKDSLRIIFVSPPVVDAGLDQE